MHELPMSYLTKIGQAALVANTPKFLLKRLLAMSETAELASTYDMGELLAHLDRAATNPANDVFDAATAFAWAGATIYKYRFGTPLTDKPPKYEARPLLNQLLALGLTPQTPLVQSSSSAFSKPRTAAFTQGSSPLIDIHKPTSARFTLPTKGAML